MSNLPEDFDQIAIVVDWLDACRKRDLAALLDLYADDASLECVCDGAALLQGRAALEAYWRPRLDTFPPSAFGLEEITPTANGVVLDYSGVDSEPVRISFSFAPDGKILQTICGPSVAISSYGRISPRTPAGL
jgi:ketosteroid isomerase-like protein